MLRGFATINYWAADLAAARDWYSGLLGIEPYFERAELDGRIIGPDDPDYERARLGYVEFRIGDYQHELGLFDSRYAPGGPATSTGGAVLYGTSTMFGPRSRSCCPWVWSSTCRSPSAGPPDSSPPPSSTPFGNVLGVMYNPRYLEVLRAKEHG